MRGKLIVIEGTDCSGKETQTNLLMKRLESVGIPVTKFSFPNYESPTGKIIAGPYLGKKYISDSWFPGGPVKVDSKVSALLYAADRLYNLKDIEKALDYGINVILDRYVYSNMAHQGGKIDSENERKDLYNWIDNLEFGFLNLPKADIRIFLHMPFKGAEILKQNRKQNDLYLDGNEKDIQHLKRAEKAYFEVASNFDFKIIECMVNEKIKSIENINDELFTYVLDKIKNN